MKYGDFPMGNEKIIDYVLEQLEKVENNFIRNSLTECFLQQTDALKKVEGCFGLHTAIGVGNEKMKYFFKSWSMTNHSCMRVSGISNRLSLRKYSGDNSYNEDMLFHSIAHLNRIADEDLGVGGGELHHDMFYRMATPICGNDDWLLKKYCTQEAVDFKTWADKSALREKDILKPLLMTLIHEIYTHGEVEFIHPMFKEWLTKKKEFREKESKKIILWITAHCYPTEANHFKHGLKAIEYYCKAYNINLEEYDAASIFNKYLILKGNVMKSLTRVYNN